MFSTDFDKTAPILAIVYKHGRKLIFQSQLNTQTIVAPDNDDDAFNDNTSSLQRANFQWFSADSRKKQIQPVEKVGGKGWPSPFQGSLLPSSYFLSDNIGGVDIALYGTFNMHVIDKYFILFNIHDLNS